MKIRSRIGGWLLLTFLFNAIPFFYLGEYFLLEKCLYLGKITACKESALNWLFLIFFVFDGFFLGIVISAIFIKKRNLNRLSTTSGKSFSVESLTPQGQGLIYQLMNYCSRQGVNWEMSSSDLIRQRIIDAVAQIDGRYHQKSLHIISLPFITVREGKFLDLKVNVSRDGSILHISIE